MEERLGETRVGLEAGCAAVGRLDKVVVDAVQEQEGIVADAVGMDDSMPVDCSGCHSLVAVLHPGTF